MNAPRPWSGDPGELVGSVIAQRYLIEGVLGEGAMGVVYAGRHMSLDRAVAIKILRPELGRRPEFRERFLREAQAASRIGHPNVVQILDFGQDGALVFSVMESLVGEDLGQRLARTGRLTWSSAAPILLSVARALGAAHASRIVHRDIKPANVMLVARDGVSVDVKVLEPLPADDPFGFGPAAVEVARRSQYSNPFPVVSNLRFKVKFALTPDPPSRPPTAKLGTAADPELFYPPSSKLRLEQGAPIVQACVGADGRLLGDPVVIESSGSADLDHAAIEVAKNSRYTAATEGGKVLKQSCLKFKVKFALTADPPVAPKT